MYESFVQLTVSMLTISMNATSRYKARVKQRYNVSIDIIPCRTSSL